MEDHTFASVINDVVKLTPEQRKALLVFVQSSLCGDDQFLNLVSTAGLLDIEEVEALQTVLENMIAVGENSAAKQSIPVKPNRYTSRGLCGMCGISSDELKQTIHGLQCKDCGKKAFQAHAGNGSSTEKMHTCKDKACKGKPTHGGMYLIEFMAGGKKISFYSCRASQRQQRVEDNIL